MKSLISSKGTSGSSIGSNHLMLSIERPHSSRGRHAAFTRMPIRTWSAGTPATSASIVRPAPSSSTYADTNGTSGARGSGMLLTAKVVTVPVSGSSTSSAVATPSRGHSPFIGTMTCSHTGHRCPRIRPSEMPSRNRCSAFPPRSSYSSRVGALITVTSGWKHSMSPIPPVRSTRHFGRTRIPVLRNRGGCAPSSNRPTSRAWSSAVSAPSGRISAHANGRSSGCSSAGCATHDHVVTVPTGPTSTNSSVTSSPVSGSCSDGGTSTRPPAVRTPTSRPSRSSLRNRPMTGPTERVYPPGNSRTWLGPVEPVSDGTAAVLPVRVAELALEELAVRLARQLLDVVDRLGPLHLREPALQRREDLGGQPVAGRDALGGLHDGLDLLAPLVVGDAEHGHVRDLRVQDDLVLDLGGVDVRPTGDDHVRLAVGQEQEAVLGEVADVADGEEVLQAALLRLLLVALVLEVDAGHLHVDRAVRARRDGVPVVVDDEQLTDRPRLPDRAGVGPPVGRARDRAAALGRRVVLPDAVAPPVEHLLLDRHRAGRRRVDRPLHARHVVAVPDVLGQGEQALEVRRDHVGVGDAVLLDEPQGLFGVPLVHVDDGVAHVQGGAAELGDGRVVVRRRDQVGLVLPAGRASRPHPEQGQQ